MTELASTIPRERVSPERLFPRLTADQVTWLKVRGRVRSIKAGDVLLNAGDPNPRLFVVLSGGLEIVAGGHDGGQVAASLGPGQFTGEVSLLSGRPALVRIQASGNGEVVEIGRDALLEIVQTSTELGEVLMRAFILRRVELVSRGDGDAVLVGSQHCAGTLRIKAFLTRNSHPYSFIDLDAADDVQALLDRFHVAVEDIPVLICRGGQILRNPTNQQVATCLGFNPTIDETHVRDLLIVGAGPAGLAAAVYAASEGLDTLVLEAGSPGGQAGSSSRIENYLGFPGGISGQSLTDRAHTQAQKFGAQVMVANGASKLACARKPYAIVLEDGRRVPARTIILAAGAEYRKLAFANVSRFEGAGIYYSATFMEAQLCRGEEVIVVGGGNSAGQAAVFLAQTATRVYMLVRGDGLAATMSRYLIRRIEGNPLIHLHTRAEVSGLEGNGHLEAVRWRRRDTDGSSTLGVRHLFVMAGAVPNTSWLDGCIALDTKGFIKTGPDLTSQDLLGARWPLGRAPYLLETSLPGVFAIGDIRSGNIKRIAPAIGEGSIAVSLAHQSLQE